MSKKRRIFLTILALIITATTACGLQESRVQDWNYSFDREVDPEEKAVRLSLITEAERWLGTTEGSPEHEQILEVYNSFEPLAQGYPVKREDEWCATFVSFAAIRCGLTDIIPTECGCQRQIGLFDALGCWEEQDGYVPLPGDIIYYCRSDKNPTEDCTGWADHVGIVVGTCNGYIKVIEGNFNETVAYRYIKVDSAGIRGFALPNYGCALENLEGV